MKISKTSIIAREAQHWAKFKRPKHPLHQRTKQRKILQIPTQQEIINNQNKVLIWLKAFLNQLKGKKLKSVKGRKSKRKNKSRNPQDLAEMLRKTMTIRREDIAYDDETEDDEPWPDE